MAWPPTQAIELQPGEGYCGHDLLVMVRVHVMGNSPEEAAEKVRRGLRKQTQVQVLSVDDIEVLRERTEGDTTT